MTDKTETVAIDKDEWYPVFSLVSNDASYATKCKIPKALAKRARKAHKEFNAVQNELADYWEQAAR